jgi:hypothetical protein
MTMSPNFDLTSLLRLQPAACLCVRCGALLAAPRGDLQCPACGVRYLAQGGDPMQFFAQHGAVLHYDDIFAHSLRLASIARDMRHSMNSPQAFYPPLRALLDSLNAAQHFVHFTTYGISAMLLGALKLTALRVDVRGIVSGVKQDTLLRELVDYTDESPRLNLRVFKDDGQTMPHQKIIVVDGLIAFKGSANMTDFGWRKAAQGREFIEIVTDVQDVIDLHNRFFSPIWAGFEPAPESISMQAQ